jgi:hypothetical protein
MKQEPVAIIEMIKFVINAGIAWAIVMGFWQMTEVQQAATLTFALAVVSLFGALWQRSQVTPIENPTDNEGVPLVRIDRRPVVND